MSELSVIIPVHNAAQYLTSCMNSVLSQRNVDFEVLAVDDGSTDESLTILYEWAQKDNRVRVFHQENGGVSSARNLGLKMATGEYVTFVDADDELLPDSMSLMISHITLGVDLVMGGYYTVEKNMICRPCDESGFVELSREAGLIQMYHPAPYPYQGYIWNKLFRRSVIEENHIRFDEDIVYNEDRLFVTRYLSVQKGNTVYDYTPVYNYYIRDNGAMGSLIGRFNPKLVTDFIAMTRMRCCVRKYFKSKELHEMADEGVFHSYAWIHQMMDQANSFNSEVHAFLRKELIKNVSFLFLIRKRFQIWVSLRR